jgi:hypothetical protein
LLDLPPLKGPHSGENIASIVGSVIDAYDISSMLGYFMMDNAEPNDTCIKELAKLISTVTEASRLRCVGHVLNLVVKALLFGKGVSKLEKALCGASDAEQFKIWKEQSFIGRLHNFCVWVNRSDQRRELFRKYIRQVNEGRDKDAQILYARVLIDGGIRWNSVYKMIKRALELREAIDLLLLYWEPPSSDDYDIREDKLTKQDWVDLQHFFEVLRPFKQLTQRMEGNALQAGLEGSHGALWETLESLDVLFRHLQEAGRFADANPNLVSEYYATGIDAARIKLEQYYGLTDATPAYRCATALHPANKWSYFETEWSHEPSWITEAKRVVTDTFAKYEAAAESVLETIEDLSQLDDEINEDELDPLQKARLRRKRQQAAEAANPRTRKRVRRNVTSELDKFMERTNPKDSDVEDPLQWWIDHQHDYPILAGMAFDFFTIPAMSSECERIFSQAKRVITDERNRLSLNTVAAIECQKQLLRSGLL